MSRPASVKAPSPRGKSVNTITVDRRTLTVSNVDKPLYPSGFTKGEVIDYYLRIAPLVLPHLRDRAVTLKRYPNGVTAPFFFEKNCASHRPDWVRTAVIHGSTGETNHCLINDRPTLLWAANLAALELHVPLAVAKAANRPRTVVFDLDPGPGQTLLDCIRLGLDLREMLKDLGLECFPKTSGSKGLHVYIPLNNPRITFDDTKDFARAVAHLFERQHPDAVTATMTKSLRAGRIFIDWSQNDTHKTTVCAYSLRAVATGPFVSAPITWKEAESALSAGEAAALSFTPQAVLRRATRGVDLFAKVLTLKQKLPSMPQ